MAVWRGVIRFPSLTPRIPKLTEPQVIETQVPFPLLHGIAQWGHKKETELAHTRQLIPGQVLSAKGAGKPRSSSPLCLGIISGALRFEGIGVKWWFVYFWMPHSIHNHHGICDKTPKTCASAGNSFTETRLKRWNLVESWSLLGSQLSPPSLFPHPLLNPNASHPSTLAVGIPGPTVLHFLH